MRFHCISERSIAPSLTPYYNNNFDENMKLSLLFVELERNSNPQHF